MHAACQLDGLCADAIDNVVVDFVATAGGDGNAVCGAGCAGFAPFDVVIVNQRPQVPIGGAGVHVDAIAHVADKAVACDDPIGATRGVDAVFEVVIVVADVLNEAVEDFDAGGAAGTAARAALDAMLRKVLDLKTLEPHMMRGVVQAEAAFVAAAALVDTAPNHITGPDDVADATR